MKLVRVAENPAFLVTCIECGKKGMSNTELFYADTEGVPFRDYYCQHCAASKAHYQQSAFDADKRAVRNA